MNFLKNLKNKIRRNILLCFICVYLTNYLKQIFFKIKNEGTFLNVSYLLILIITTFVLCETYYYTISHYPSFLGTVDLISTLDSFYTTYTSTKDGIIYFYATNYTLTFTLKVTLCLMFLIVIRGCVPRYRYDFLTKMGWVKFLGYILTIFLISIILFLIW